MGDDGVLVETRKLLNTLNDENAQLRERNHELAAHVRDTDAAFTKLRHEKDALERDMKQINVNLMQQLQNRARQVKELERSLAQHDSAVRDAAGSIAAFKQRATDVECRSEALAEQVRQLEAKLREESVAHEGARAAHDRCRAELERVTSSSREAERVAQSESSAVVSRLRGEVASLEGRLRDAVAGRDAAQQRLEEERRAHSAERTRLIADAQRTMEAEAEVRYMHEQMHEIATFVHQYLAEVQGRVRSLVADAEGNDATLQALVNRGAAQQAALHAFRSCDESVMKLTAAHMGALERQSDERGREQQLQREAAETAARHGAELEAALRERDARVTELLRATEAQRHEAADAQKACAGLRERVAGLEAEVRSLSASGDGLKAELADVQARLHVASEAQHAAEMLVKRERSEAADEIRELRHALRQLQNAQRGEFEEWEGRERSYQREIEELRMQLQQHADTLATALGRLSTSASFSAASMPPPPHQHQMQRRRSSSSAAASDISPPYAPPRSQENAPPHAAKGGGASSAEHHHDWRWATSGVASRPPQRGWSSAPEAAYETHPHERDRSSRAAPERESAKRGSSAETASTAASPGSAGEDLAPPPQSLERHLLTSLRHRR